MAGFALLTATLAEAQERPSAPTITSVESVRGTIKVSWTWGADNGCTDQRSVRIQYAANQSDFDTNTYIDQYNGSGAGASHTFTGVAVGTYAVRMYQGGFRSDGTNCGLGMESNYVNVTVSQPPNIAPVIAGPDTVAVNVDEDIGPWESIGARFSATDADGDTITWSLEGQNAALFAVNQQGEVATGTNTSFNYESGNTSYTFKLKASDNFDGSDVVTINVTIMDRTEPPGTPAAPAVSASGSSLTVSWSAPDNTGPLINDYDLRYRKGTSGSWAGAGHDGAATSARITDLKENTSYEVQVRARNAEGESGWSPSGTGSTGSNRAPVITNKTPSEREVYENSATGTNVGEAFTASDADGNTLTWTLSGEHASLFAIAAGQITVAAHIDRDAYESQLLSVTVTVSDGTASDSVVVTVRMGNKKEPPGTPDPPTVSPSGTGLAVSWSKPDNDGPPINDYDLHYREVGSGSWADGGYDGEATSARIGGLKENTSYEVQVKAKSPEGDSDWSESGIGSTDVNRAPVITNKTPSERKTIENALPGRLVGDPFTASDPDEDALTWSLAGANAALFSIDAGQIKVAGTLDKEDAEYRNVTVTVSDGALSDSVVVRIRVMNVLEPPLKPGTPNVEGASKSSLAVSWTAPDNTGRPPINGYDVRFRAGTSGGWSIGSVTGTSATITELAVGTSYQVRVMAKNADGESAWSGIGTGSTHANQAPVLTNKTPSGRAVDENEATGELVGAAFTATDANAEDTLTWALSGPDAGLFSIDGGQIKVDGALNHEAAATRSVTVTVSDGTASDSVDVTVTVGDVPEPPGKPDQPNATASTKTSLTMSWTAPATTGPAINDYDVQYRAGTTVTWTAHPHSGTGTSATITGLAEHTTYQVQVQAKNAEGPGAWSDSGEGTTEENAAPVITNEPSGGALSVKENTTPTLYTFEASDADADDTITWTLSGTDSGSFTISQDADGHGVLAPASGTTFDFETKESYSFTVLASDGALSDSVAITLSVEDVDEPPDAPGAPGVSGASKTSLSVTWSAPSNTGPQIDDYDVQYREETSGNWIDHAHTGDGTSTTITGLEENTSYQVQVKAKSPEGESDWSPHGTGSTHANQAPVITNKTPSGREVPENSASGKNVGAAFTATDANAEDTLTWSLSGPDAGLFSIDGGQIKVAGALNHEAAATRNVTVTVSDGTASDSVDVTVTVGDVPDEAPGKPDPPNATASTKTSLTMSWAEPANTGPAINDYDVQYRAGTTGNWTAHPHSGTGTSATITGLVEHTTYQVQVQATNAEGTGAWSNSGTGTTEENATPAISNKPTNGALSVEENTAPTLYTFEASDADADDTITWTLEGTDSASFTISQNADGYGVLDPASETTFNFEAKDSYSFTVRASDGALSDSVAITLSVTNVDEPPDAPAAPTATASTKMSVTMSWTEPANTGPAINDYDVQYRAGTTGNWTDHPHSDTETSATIAGLAEDTAYEVQVRATNDEGTSDWSDIGTGNTEENAAPVITNKPSGGALSVMENATGTQSTRVTTLTTSRGGPSVVENATETLYTFKASDADGDSITWMLEGTDQASFTISRSAAGNGVLSPASGTMFDFEVKASYSFTVRASDGALSDSVTITLSVMADDTEAPSAPDFGNATVSAQHWVSGSAIEPVTIPAATGGNGRLVYVASGLPAGVRLSADRAVVGTPAIVESGAARVRVFDESDNTDTLTFDWTVAEDTAPDFGNATVPAQHWVSGSAITAFTIPPATGGNAPLTYTADRLPAGVSLSADGVVSGTPASSAAGSGMATVRVTDANGDTATLPFAWTVDHPDSTLSQARNTRLAQTVLPRVGQALVAGPLRGVATRLTSLQQGTPTGLTYQVGGQSKLDALAMNLGQTLNQGQMDWRQLVGESAFSLTLTPAGQKNAGLRDVVLWGQGMYQHLASRGSASAETWNGGVLSAQLGVDARVHPQTLVGVLVNWGEGTMDWQTRGSDAPGAGTTGDFEVELTSVHPYVGWASKDGAIEGWGTMGYGWGDLTITEAQATSPAQGSDLTLYSGAVGTTGRLLADTTLLPGGTTTLRAKGDVSMVQMRVAETETLAHLRVDTQRLRALLEMAHTRALPLGGQVTPSLEVGLRHDAGAGPTGTGLETGMGLRYQQPAWGLTVDGQMRFLTLSSADYDEWGGALQVQVAPGPTQEGAQASLTTAYGASGSGIDRLWTQELPQPGGPGMGQGLGTTRLAAEVGYGVAVGPLGSAGSTGVVVPYSGITVTGAGARAYRVGGRLLWGRSGAVSLEGAQQEQAIGITDHRLLLQGQWQF